jgi:HAD superfamily hydrolase (TIGR01509 family)
MTHHAHNDDSRAVLWDMDGVIVDSATYHYEAWRQALAPEGHDLAYEEFRRTFGQRNDTILRALFGQDHSDADIDRVANLKEALYRELVRTRGISPLPGVMNWLQKLREEGWRQAVASAAPRANVLAIIEALGVAPYFGALTSSEDVTRGKPDPQVYLVAASRLIVAPEHCIVIEDAPAGLEGARRAGMKCIGVTSTHDHLEADLVVHRLDELDPDAFDRLSSTARA